jgi:hypothetical protein
MILLVGCWGRLVTVNSLLTRQPPATRETAMKLFALGFAALLATGSAFAADVTSASDVIHDKTGFFLHLDVDKVLSSTDISGQCGIVPAYLRYLDHQGREHLLDYQVQGVGCASDN